tara:strand:+ start:91 stop:306 length:216 start_codon:yes stop_codon:yes gene_type:complete
LFGHLKFVKQAVKVVEETAIEQLPLPKQVKDIVEQKLEDKIGLVDDKHKSIEERLDKIESAIEIILDKLTR